MLGVLLLMVTPRKTAHTTYAHDKWGYQLTFQQSFSNFLKNPSPKGKKTTIVVIN